MSAFQQHESVITVAQVMQNLSISALRAQAGTNSKAVVKMRAHWPDSQAKGAPEVGFSALQTCQKTFLKCPVIPVPSLVSDFNLDDQAAVVGGRAAVDLNCWLMGRRFDSLSQ